MDKKKRSLSRQAVRALSARPPSGRGGQYVSYADIPQTREDEEWAADRAQSPSAAGAKLRWDASMQELRSRTDLTRPRSPSRQASRSVTRSVSRRSGEGDDDDGDDDPDVMQAAGSRPERIRRETTLRTRGHDGGAAGGARAEDRSGRGA